MLDSETVPCPVCDKEISVKVNRPSNLAKDIRYYAIVDCNNCKTSANKIEKMLNSTRSTKPKIERSYFKLDPRG